MKWWNLGKGNKIKVTSLKFFSLNVDGLRSNRTRALTLDYFQRLVDNTDKAKEAANMTYKGQFSRSEEESDGEKTDDSK